MLNDLINVRAMMLLAHSRLATRVTVLIDPVRALLCLARATRQRVSNDFVVNFTSNTLISLIRLDVVSYTQV